MKNTTTMVPETTSWPDVGLQLAWVLPLFAAIWHFINKFFADKEKDRVALIADVAKRTAEETVRETVLQYITPLEKQIKEVSSKVETGLRDVHDRIDKVLAKK